MGCPGTGRPGVGRVAPPIGTPGWTGGGTARIGALYTGLGPVCGTIMRGAGGGVGGRTELGAEADGDAAAGGIGGAGAGGTGRAGAATGVVATGGATTGRAATGGAGGAAAGGVGGGAGFVTAGATVVGRLTAAGGAAAGFSAAGGVAGGAAGRAATEGGAAVSFFCVIALSTSPGREIFERSIFVLISSSPREMRELDFPAEEEPSAEERMYTRTFSASCSSKELECVFFSVTPTKGSVSRIARLFTSSSRARSLIRTLLIRPFDSPRCS